MRLAKEAYTKIAHASGQQTRRLHRYQKRLRKDATDRCFDERAVELLMEYARDPSLVRAEVDYLDNLKDGDGNLFCRSTGKYSDMEQQFGRFIQPEKASFRWNRHYQAAVAKVKERYSQAHAKMIEYSSDEDIYDSVTDWTTATGWTMVTDGIAHKRGVLGNIFSVHSEIESEARRNGSFGRPILCGKRTYGQHAYDDDGNRTGTWDSRMRAVFMVDVMTIISESRWGSPLNDWLRGYSYTAIGKSDREIQLWVNSRRERFPYFISLDYSQYDTSIPSWLIHSAFDVIRCAFQSSDEELLAVIEADFIDKCIVTADGYLEVHHGNPSGSRLTSIINGICNEIITETWKSAFNIEADYQIMGDDNLIFISNVRVDKQLVDRIGSYIMHNFGIKVHPGKENFGSAKTKPPVYLSRTWRWEGADRCDGEVIAHLAFPEKRRPYLSKSKVVTPEIVLYSYILAYPVAMRRLMDVERFIRAMDFSWKNLEWTKEMVRSVPYNVRLHLELDNKIHRAPLAVMLEAA